MRSKKDDILRQMLLKHKKPLVYEKFQHYDEKIAKGESIAHIQIQYDTLCNMNCEHCCVPQDVFVKNTTRVMTPNDVSNIFKQADEMGLARAGVSGGEPLAFKDLDKIIDSICPENFWIQLETNGLLLNEAKAKHLSEIGIDKIQLSIDSLNEKEHDTFRRKPGSWQKAIDSIDIVKNSGMQIAINTFVTKQRLYTDEFFRIL